MHVINIPMQNLVQYLRRNGKLNEKESAVILSQIVALVESSHRNNIPCLNLLAENIVLDRNKNVHIVDRKEKGRY